MRLASVILGLILFSLIVGCVPLEKQCSADSDCVEKTCCHSNDAVNKEYAPDCVETLCTQECVPGTTDCGLGEANCVSGQCRIVKK